MEKVGFSGRFGKRAVTVLLAMLAGVGSQSSAHARLGEKRDQIEARFGKAKQQIDNVEGLPTICECWYEDKGITIVATYIQGVCYSEHYLRQPPNNSFSKEEITVLMEANKVGRRWMNFGEPDKVLSSADGYWGALDYGSGGEWELFDRTSPNGLYAVAMYSVGDTKRPCELSITVAAYRDYVDRVKMSQAKATLKNF